MYVCGVTAYDLSHIGHARAYIAFDVLYRYLKHLGYAVTYVRNFTDVDDKIITRAKLLGEEPLDLSKRFSDEFLSDMSDLNVLVPTEQPRIIENGCAYAADGDVYFSVDQFPDYGRLSGRKQEGNRAGAGGRSQEDLTARKINQNDFALWKAAKPGEISWESPWGPGRPGWHIECSAMSERYLTSSFDIHGGGMDLIFPHHENELAQSCAARPDTCKIRYWMHNGFVNIDNEKMSKSLGNFFTIREVTRLYHPLALRYFMMSTHYRSAVNYSYDQLEIASGSVFYLYQTLRDCEEALLPFREQKPEGSETKGKNLRITPEAQECINKLKDDFYAQMADDFTRSRLLACLVNKLKKARQHQQSLFLSLAEMEKEVKMILDTLGLMSSSSYSEVLEQFKAKTLTRANCWRKWGFSCFYLVLV
ncbi:hypothetical protein MKW94_028885 [Papaver nudicaule]|uniref:cysteine--tRNA ligase n=1 Tax=Papaver nudicaule TaxID=74823 RepID=A0AA41VC98_PAPNU|nr:hypothetical protein [Papaver nudicaule]